MMPNPPDSSGHPDTAMGIIDLAHVSVDSGRLHGMCP